MNRRARSALKGLFASGLQPDGDIVASGSSEGNTTGDIFTLPSHLEFSPAGQPDATLIPTAITAASHSGTVTFLPGGGFVVALPCSPAAGVTPMSR